jgi:hypothetical protein
MEQQHMSIDRPLAGEFAPYYATYIDIVARGDVIATLERQIAEYRTALGGLDEEKALYRYSPGKWTVKEVLGHVIDSERVFAYRAMRIARSDATPLAGFDENQFVANAGFNIRALPDLLAEFEYLRRGNIHFFRSLTPDVAARRGTANQLGVSVRAIVYLTAGHAAHHLGLLREKYL